MITTWTPSMLKVSFQTCGSAWSMKNLGRRSLWSAVMSSEQAGARAKLAVWIALNNISIIKVKILPLYAKGLLSFPGRMGGGGGGRGCAGTQFQQGISFHGVETPVKTKLPLYVWYSDIFSQDRLWCLCLYFKVSPISLLPNQLLVTWRSLISLHWDTCVLTKPFQHSRVEDWGQHSSIASALLALHLSTCPVHKSFFLPLLRLALHPMKRGKLLWSFWGCALQDSLSLVDCQDSPLPYPSSKISVLSSSLSLMWHASGLQAVGKSKLLRQTCRQWFAIDLSLLVWPQKSSLLSKAMALNNLLIQILPFNTHESEFREKLV